MCVLIQTHPKSSRRLTRMARPWSLVNTLEARPYLHAVGPADRLVLVGEVLDGDDGAEDLVLGRLVVLLEAGDDGGGVEIAPSPKPFSADGYLGVVGEPLDHARDVLELGWVVEGTVEDVLVVGIARLGVPRLLGEGLHEVVVGARGGEDPRGGGAVLAGVEVAGRPAIASDAASMSASSKTMTGALPPSSRCTPLEVVGGRFGDLHPCPDGACDGDHLGRGVLDERPGPCPCRRTPR